MGTDRPEELRAGVARACERFTTPPGCAASARELEVFARARPFCIERAPGAAGASFAAYSFGAGPAVALLHGWGGRATQLASFVEPIVERGFCVVAADAPAHGASPGARSSVLDFVELAEALAERCGPLYGAVGHSLGAAAILMALERGMAAERVALVAPTAHLLDELGSFELATGRTTLVAIAPRIRVATLVVHDEHDPEVPFHASADLAAALPRGTLHATRGLGHFAPLRTRAVIERVVAYVTSLPDGS